MVHCLLQLPVGTYPGEHSTMKLPMQNKCVYTCYTKENFRNHQIHMIEENTQLRRMVDNEDPGVVSIIFL